jgi:hypothetical protein
VQGAFIVGHAFGGRMTSHLSPDSVGFIREFVASAGIASEKCRCLMAKYRALFSEICLRYGIFLSRLIFTRIMKPTEHSWRAVILLS